MQLNRLRRQVLAASAVAIAFSLPLTLTGCGGSGDTSAAPGGAPKDFKETHKDSMNEYLKQKAAQKGAHR